MRLRKLLAWKGVSLELVNTPDEISPDPLRGASLLCVTKRALSVPVSLVEGCAKCLFFFDRAAREDNGPIHGDSGLSEKPT